MATQEIVLHITVEVPEASTPAPKVRGYTGYSYYRYSEKKGAMLVRNMTKWHLANAIKKDMALMSLDEVMTSPVLQEMLYRLAEAIEPVI